MTPTIKIATAISPKIQAYSIILPHQPLPSVILVSAPILLLAASMPRSPFSMPAPAADSTSFSCSRSLWKAKDCDLSVCAMLRRDSVSLSCSARWWSRMASVVAVVLSAVVGDECLLPKSCDLAVVSAVSAPCGWPGAPRDRRLCWVDVPCCPGAAVDVSSCFVGRGASRVAGSVCAAGTVVRRESGIIVLSSA